MDFLKMLEEEKKKEQEIKKDKDKQQIPKRRENQLSDVQKQKLGEELYIAVTEKSVIKVKKLIEQGIDVNIQDEHGKTVLIIAAHFGRQKMCQLLINAGADVNIQDKLGNTALIKAAYFGYQEICQLLINAGTNVKIKDIYRKTAKDYAKESRLNDIVKLLGKQERKADQENEQYL